MNVRRFALLAVGFFTVSLIARADDWPQWRGPNRDGISKETGLLKAWPKDGPKQLWKNAMIGGGYSTPSVVSDRVYLLGDKDKQESLIVLDTKDGTEQWRTKIGSVAKDGPPSYPGPRSTPTVDGDLIYVLGSDGDLLCVEKAKGAVVWKKNLKKDFAGKMGVWAYAESPLIDGDWLICTPGGAQATMLALNKKTGETIWKCPIPGGLWSAYASAMISEAGGVKQYVQFVSNALVGVEAKTGKSLWQYKKNNDPFGVNIPTPLVHGDLVFTTTGGGAALLRLAAKDGGVAAEEVHRNGKMSGAIGGAVRVGDHIYFTTDKLICLKMATGEVIWENPCVGAASICVADGLLYVRGQGGTGMDNKKEPPSHIALVEATPDGYKERGRFEQPDHGNRPAWPYPVVANGRLYLRDQGVLLCYDVKDAGK
jgi:outer membrane protein assembly factor BamB